MKINSVNVDKFLKGEKFLVNRDKSRQLTRHKPSIKKNHIKNPKRVTKALRDLDINHNWSWYEEIYDRWLKQNKFDSEAIFYRGNSITAKEMFAKADDLAKSLDKIGIKKGDEILACMSNVPEEIYLLLAASKRGAVVKFIGPDFNKDYLNEIVNRQKRKLFIGTDDQYGKIADIIEKSDIECKVLVSLTDSLPNGKNPYSYLDNDFYKFENHVPKFQGHDNSIITFNDFIEFGKGHICEPIKVSINDSFTRTFTSGSTKIGNPKEIEHLQKHYISIARFHDPDLSRMPAMRNMRGLAHIPTHSNTNIACSISDPLAQCCSVACEPIYQKNFLLRSIMINDPGYLPATKSQLIAAAKQLKKDPLVKNIRAGKLVNVASVGEGTNENERRFIDNELLKPIQAGCDVLPKPLAPVPVSLGGGDCEHGGLLFTLFYGLRQKFSLFKESKREYGLTPFQLASLAVLREDGTECDFGEYGRLVSDSYCTMKEYVNNTEATNKFFCTDAYGRTWGDNNVWAYIGKNGNVRVKGRYDSIIPLSTGQKVPNFLINEVIESDLDNILSCETVTVRSEDDIPVVVAHLEMLPNSTSSIETVLTHAEERCQKLFSEELAGKIFYKVRSNEESFPLTGSLKRSVKELEAEGLDDFCIKPIITDNEVVMTDAKTYIRNQEYSKPKVNEKFE